MNKLEKEMKKYTLELGGKNLVVQIKNLAEQANGNVLAQYGDTVVLATAVMSEKEKAGAGFFPLTVDYEERYYAAGKIKGSRFMKRESRPSEEAILNARAIDRTLRPRFNINMRREVQVIVTVLSWDAENDPDVLGILAASLALSISDIPWAGPIAAVRIGRAEEQYILNPSYEQREKSDLDMVWTAGEDEKNNLLINMIEAKADEIEESAVLGALDFSKEYFQKLIDFQKEIVKEIGKEKTQIELPAKNEELEQEIKKFWGENLQKALFQKDKKDRMQDVNKLKNELLEWVLEKYPEDENAIKSVETYFESEVDRIVHEEAIKNNLRVDGRKMDEVREIICEVGLLPRTHGSGLFQRGSTKALSILTLGSPGDQQLLEGMEITGKKRFMHHYNFPPYSTGETGPMRGPGRRDIGHGMLAEKALLPLIPAAEEFPYTIRIVSEIVSSNGSSSMASISGASLALMDAGVPIKRPATGIAIGLMRDKEGNYKILSDIQGPEDHHGDMDMKVAGTKKGITAIQMDTKIKGLTDEIIRDALTQAKKNRLEILDVMEKAISGPRATLSSYAPRILTIQINPEKIGAVVGTGGKIINEIIKETETAIDINPSGLIFVTAEKEENVQKAIQWIENLTKEVKIGEIYEGKVKRILEFGAFVEILPGLEGMIHISQLAPYRVKKVEDVVRIGDIVTVKIISIDEQGRINLSLKEANNR